MAQGTTITQEQASPFVGGAPDQFVTPALSTETGPRPTSRMQSSWAGGARTAE